jgi:MSHA biogenesis protein MshP
MSERARSRPAARAQRGFTIVSGIVLVTILALLAAYMLSLRATQSAGNVLDALGSRAHAAARTGTEWGAYSSLTSNTCAPTTALALTGPLAGFTVTVTCSRATYNEAGDDIHMDTIVATACNQPAGGNCPNAAPGANYVEREIVIQVAR